MKHTIGENINPVGHQLKFPLVQRLIDLDWPHWIIPEQRRIQPGLFDLPNKIFYDGRISYHADNVLQPEARLMEYYLQTKYKMTAAPVGKVYPGNIDIRNSTSFVKVNGTSRGSTQFVYVGINFITRFLSWARTRTQFLNVTVRANNFVILCGYKKQQKLYQGAIDANPLSHG
jgi:hypothetical protein